MWRFRRSATARPRPATSTSTIRPGPDAGTTTFSKDSPTEDSPIDPTPSAGRLPSAGADTPPLSLAQDHEPIGRQADPLFPETEASWPAHSHAIDRGRLPQAEMQTPVPL